MTNETLRDEVKKVWNGNARFWDGQVGQYGNSFHRILIEPAQEKLLQISEGDLILDIACGNGQFSRRMADRGAMVHAFDVAENFVALARERSLDYGERINYFVMDAGDRGALEALGEGRFDSAVCTMAIMDMATIEPMAAALRRILKKGGRFVFSLCHPCFNSDRIKRVMEQEDRDGDVVTSYSVSMSGYLTPSVLKGIGIVGQPEVQYYFHRSLSELFNLFFACGFMLNGLEEPSYPEGSSKNPFWKVHAEIPAALIARLVLAE